MKHLYPATDFRILFITLTLLLSFNSCKDEEIPQGSIFINSEDIDFGEVRYDSPSSPMILKVYGSDVHKEITAKVTGDFEISVNGTDYSETVTIPAEEVNTSVSINIRCSPSEKGELKGTITISGENIETKTVSLLAYATDMVQVSVFSNERIAFGNGYSQSITKTVNFPVAQEDVQKMIMYIKLRCPDEGCNKWDMYANINIKDPESGEWLEMGRYITPYGVDNSQRTKGFEIDVTDFKSLLTGSVELKAFIETKEWESLADKADKIVFKVFRAGILDNKVKGELARRDKNSILIEKESGKENAVPLNDVLSKKEALLALKKTFQTLF